MKTKEKVEYWINKYPHLRDDDNRLCSNIWNEEIKKYIITKESSYKDFLRLYSLGRLTAATSIRRARAKLQEENPEYRGKKYKYRKTKIQDEYKKEYGYKVNK
tara:strand:+ start:1159 stop:1467 length:309 start_codon:yes stop_codon:yes gene_type:complete